MKKHHLNKTNKELLLAGIHAYGVNMWCAGKHHGEDQEKRYDEAADDIMLQLVKIINAEVKT